MLTAEEIVGDEASVRAYLKKFDQPEVSLVFSEGQIDILSYGYDPRIDWDTHILLVDGEPAGFTDGPLSASSSASSPA